MSFAIAGTVLTVGATAYAANRAGAAADRQAGAADAATAETARQYDQTRADLAPYRVTGGGALNQLAGLFGLPTTTPEDFQAQVQSQQGGGAPNFNSFFQSPGYEFRRNEGMRGLERTAAARGGAFSGNALRALTDFNSNLASSEFGNYFNQLASVAGIGQTATNQTAGFGAHAADSAGRNALNAGDARASGIINQANIMGSGINQLAGMAGYGWGGKKDNHLQEIPMYSLPRRI